MWLPSRTSPSSRARSRTSVERHREHEEPRLARELARIGGRLERLGQRRGRAAAGSAASVWIASTTAGVARPQDDAAARAREHRAERGAERAGADDADGVARARSRTRASARDVRGAVLVVVEQLDVLDLERCRRCRSTTGRVW